MAAAELAKSRTGHVQLLAVCRQVLAGECAVETAIAQFTSMQEKSPVTASLLYDVFSAVDCEMDEHNKAMEEPMKRFRELLYRAANTVIPDDVLRVDLEVLGAASDPAMRSRMVKARTRLFYKQMKFNLLREESEGYAKLICELIDCNFHITPSAALARIHRLIGQFNLDPNRVMDIVLECFECAPNRRPFFIDLLRELKSDREDLCHMLGFKFTFYQKSEDTPLSLYVIAAALCHEEMIDMLQLCSYLVPKQEQIMADHKQRIEAATKRSKKAEVISTAALPTDPTKQSASMNVDESSGAAGGGPTAPVQGMPFAAVSAAQDAQDPGEDDTTVLARNQKLGLVCALLEMGNWQLAKQLLDRFPEFYAVNASKRISIAITDIVGAAMDDFYKEKCKQYQICCELPRPSRKTAANVSATGSSISGGPFEIIGSWTDLNSILIPVLNYLGPHIAYRPLVATKLVRLLTAFFAEKTKQTDPDAQANYEQLSHVLIDVCDGILVPSLTLSEAPCAFSEELWTLLSSFPYTLRYRMYGRWKNLHTVRHPQLLVQRGKTIGKTRYVVKRLSKETIKMMGRQLGKLCHLHAPVVFDYLLNQIQTFENLIGPVVESIRFLTSFEFDVLSWWSYKGEGGGLKGEIRRAAISDCIIEQLGSPDKQQLKASDGTFSPWLQALSTFIGTVFKKYNMELTGVLQYVANQLKNGKSFDLLVLRDIIQNMSGIETTTALTQDQLEALAGGDLLRQEAGSFGAVRNVRRATGRLRDALVQEDLIVGLCILTAQQRACIVYQESEGIPLKLAGQMLDQCQDTLVQFGSFLWANLKTEDYSQRMPTAPELIAQYMVPPDAAMFLSRPSYMHAINTRYQKEKKEAEERLVEKGPLAPELKYTIYTNAFDSVMKPLESAIRPLFPDAMWKDFSPRLFAIFWSLTLYDLNVPSAAYERELEKVRKAIAGITENVDNVSKTKRSKEEERLKALETRFVDECRHQTEHVTRIKQLLAADKQRLFDRLETRAQQMTRFMQTCILPRAVLTDMDAVYCAKFIEQLHAQRTPCFYTAMFLNRLLVDPLPLYAGLSENEAGCFGRFLCLVLGMISRWHADRAVFDKECFRFPGFAGKLIKITEPTEGTGTDYEEFRALCLRWHLRLSRAFISVISGGNYVQMRNTLAVLIKILPHFPMVKQHNLAIESRVIKARDAEKGRRDDLSLMAASYAGQLKMRKVKLLTDREFCPVSESIARVGDEMQATVATTPKKPVTTVASTATAGSVANSANANVGASSLAERRTTSMTNLAGNASNEGVATVKKEAVMPSASAIASAGGERKRPVAGSGEAVATATAASVASADGEAQKKRQKTLLPLATTTMKKDYGSASRGDQRKEEGEIVDEAGPITPQTLKAGGGGGNSSSQHTPSRKARSTKSVDEVRPSPTPTSSSQATRDRNATAATATTASSSSSRTVLASSSEKDARGTGSGDRDVMKRGEKTSARYATNDVESSTGAASADRMRPSHSGKSGGTSYKRSANDSDVGETQSEGSGVKIARKAENGGGGGGSSNERKARVREETSPHAKYPPRERKSREGGTTRDKER